MRTTAIGYPTCTGLNVRCGQAPWNGIGASYTNGWLTAMSATGSSTPSLADSITYSPNGIVNSVAHSNGVTDTIAADPSDLPRATRRRRRSSSIDRTAGP